MIDVEFKTVSLFWFISLFCTIIWQRYIYYTVEKDFKSIQADGSKNSLGKWWHFKGAAWRVIFAAVLSLLYIYFSIWTSLAIFVLLLTVYWKYFDRLLNVKRGKPTNYVGQTSSIDRWFRSYFTYDPHSVMERTKNILIIVSVVLLIASFF